jgi:hypothetical protein
MLRGFRKFRTKCPAAGSESCGKIRKSRFPNENLRSLSGADGFIRLSGCDNCHSDFRRCDEAGSNADGNHRAAMILECATHALDHAKQALEEKGGEAWLRPRSAAPHECAVLKRDFRHPAKSVCDKSRTRTFIDRDGAEIALMHLS